MRGRIRLLLGGAALSLLATACSGGLPEAVPGESLVPSAGSGPSTARDIRRLDVPTAGWRTDFTKASVDFGEIVGGGPPRDGIPAIDAPTYEAIADTRAWWDDQIPVISLVVGGKARAYPLAILMWHEIEGPGVSAPRRHRTRPVTPRYAAEATLGSRTEPRVGHGRAEHMGETAWTNRRQSGTACSSSTAA